MRGGIIMYNQLDIVLMPFPFNDLTSRKVRPALIFSNSKVRNDKICFLITSKKTTKGIELTNDLITGTLPLKSWLKPHRIFTIDETKIIKKICSGNNKLYNKIQKEFSKITEFE